MNNTKNLILLIFILFGSFLFGQEEHLKTKNVSPAIQNYIQANYPGATKIKYYKDKEETEILTECEFRLKGEHYSLAFKNDTLVETEFFLSFDEMPANVQSSVNQSLDSLFSKYKIIECQEVNPQAGLLYEIYVKGNSQELSGYFELFFDANGILVKKVEIVIEPISTQN